MLLLQPGGRGCRQRAKTVPQQPRQQVPYPLSKHRGMSASSRSLCATMPPQRNTCRVWCRPFCSCSNSCSNSLAFASHHCRSGCLRHRRRRLTRQRRISGSSPHHHRRRRRRHRRAPVLLRRALAIPQGSPCHSAGQCHMQCCSPCRSAGQRDTVAIRCRGGAERMGRSCRGQLSCRLSI